VHQRDFDLVLCDYNLPSYDGVSALKYVKTVRPSLPVIIISGTVGESEAVKCLHSGATDYLLKQRLERLVPAVRRALREADERRRRLQAEQEVRLREQRLSSIYEAVADGLFHLEVLAPGRYRFLSVNPAFVQTTGLPPQEAVGASVEDVLPAAFTVALLTHADRAVREHRIERWACTAVFRSGQRTLETSITPVIDAGGICTHLVGVAHDATERRALEDQLRQAQKMESVGQLAGGIAHDFNNLLTVINGMAEFAVERAAQVDPQMQEDLMEIRRAGDRAAALTRQLLAFSRKQILQPRNVNLNGIVEEMGSLLHRLLGEDVELTLDVGGEAASVNADPGQLEQVIVNLAVNARDAMPQGGSLTIRVRRENTVAGEPGQEGPPPDAGPWAVLEITDSGSGMDEDVQRQIFEPFFTTKGPGKGTGLGLSTVYGIVKQSGGFVRVRSAVGQGTTFSIYLPRAVEGRDSHGDLGPEHMKPGSETVLVVEDVGGLRRLMTRTLESSGYRVVEAASGDEALRILDAYPNPVDLMITDVVMPGITGRDLAEKMRHARPSMKVLYMSGYTDDVIVRHGVQESRMPFVSKPFTPRELERAVRQVLDA
jgi:PAS domain S-box-containing protein